MTKLNQKRVKWLVRQVVHDGKKASVVAKVYDVSVRRVQQLAKYYRDTGKMPVLNKARRPKTMLTDEQKSWIKEAFLEKKLSARLLYFELKKREKSVPKNKLYAYLKQKGWVIPNKKKQKQRKRCRYEWKHSGDMLHADTHRTSQHNPYCILWLDDASRKIIGGIESKTPATNVLTIESLKKALKHAKLHNVRIKSINTDRGTEFFSNWKHKNPISLNAFEQFLVEQGIKHIPSRPNNPQTNGKIERHWREYDKHRWDHQDLDHYIAWYNQRLHGALDLQRAETPKEAWIRKLPPETLIGLLFK